MLPPSLLPTHTYVRRTLSYDIIYRLVEGLGVTVASALPPVVKDTIIGSAEVLQTFSIGGANPVAGCRVKDGVVKRNSQLKLLRKGEVVAVSESGADSMKHFKDDVTTAKAGTEFAISFAVRLCDLFPLSLCSASEENNARSAPSSPLHRATLTASRLCEGGGRAAASAVQSLLARARSHARVRMHIYTRPRLPARSCRECRRMATKRGT